MKTELEKEAEKSPTNCNNQGKDKSCIKMYLVQFCLFCTSVIFKKAAVLEMTFPCVSIAPLGFPDEQKSHRSR